MIQGFSQNNLTKNTGNIEFQYKIVDTGKVGSAGKAGGIRSAATDLRSSNEELFIDDPNRAKLTHFRLVKQQPGYVNAYVSGFSDYLRKVKPDSNLMISGSSGMVNSAPLVRSDAINLPDELFSNLSNDAISVTPQNPEQLALLEQVRNQTSASPYYGIDNFSILNNIMNRYNSQGNQFPLLPPQNNGMPPDFPNGNPNILNYANPYSQNNLGVEWPGVNGDPNILKLLNGDMSAVALSNPDELKNMIAQLGTLKNQYGSNIQQLETIVGTLTEQLQQLESEKGQLEGVRNQQVQQFRQEEALYQQLVAKKQQLTTQSQQLNQQKAALETQITSLTEGIQAMTASVSAMEAEAAALSANPLTAAAGAAMYAQVANLKAQIAMMQTQKAQAQAQLKQTEVQIKQTAAQLKQTEQAIAQSQKKLEGIRAAIEDTDKKLVAVNEQIVKISAQINQGLNLIVERKTNMAMCDIRANNLQSFSQTYSMIGKNKPSDANGFLRQMQMGGGASNILNTITGIASLFGFGGVSGGGLLSFFK